MDGSHRGLLMVIILGSRGKFPWGIFRSQEINPMGPHVAYSRDPDRNSCEIRIVACGLPKMTKGAEKPHAS